MALLGQPTASAKLITPDLLKACKTWLDCERRYLCWKMAADSVFRARYSPCFPEGPGITPVRVSTANRVAYFESIRGVQHHVGQSGRYHHRTADKFETYQRAALVLSAVGCDSRDGRG